MPHAPSLCVVQLTPPGRGAVATLLVEGSGAAAAIERHFRARGGRPLADAPSNRIVVGHFGPEAGEEIVVRRRSAESLELHCHGGQAAVGLIQDVLAQEGFQLVGWQDWVRGQESDPIAAAARIALADARTEPTAAILLDQYHGALRRVLTEIRALLARGETAAAHGQIAMLLGRAALGRHLVQPWRVAVAGRPNVGKSSLINALVGYARAIVHPTPGTTRDVVTVRTAIGGWPVELADTAGWREAHDPLEQAGIELAQQTIAAADLAVLVFDRSAAWTQEDEALLRGSPGALVVCNKSDLPPAAEWPQSIGRPGHPDVNVSALEHEGMDALVGKIAARLVPDPPPPGEALPFTEEQVAELTEILRNVDAAADAAPPGTTQWSEGGGPSAAPFQIASQRKKIGDKAVRQ